MQKLHPYLKLCALGLVGLLAACGEQPTTDPLTKAEAQKLKESLVQSNKYLTQVATYKILASRLKLWAKMKPHTLSTKPWRVVA